MNLTVLCQLHFLNETGKQFFVILFTIDLKRKTISKLTKNCIAEGTMVNGSYIAIESLWLKNICMNIGF